MCGDVRMVERGEQLRLALEARQALRVLRRTAAGSTLMRDLAAEPRVARAVDLAHAARAERRHDLVGSEPGARGERAQGLPPAPCSRGRISSAQPTTTTIGLSTVALLRFTTIGFPRRSPLRLHQRLAASARPMSAPVLRSACAISHRTVSFTHSGSAASLG